MLEVPSPAPGRAVVLRASEEDRQGWHRYMSAFELELKEHRIRDGGSTIGPGVTRWYLSLITGIAPMELPMLRPDRESKPDIDCLRLPKPWRQLSFSRTSAPTTSWSVYSVDAPIGIDTEPWPSDRAADLAPFFDLLPPSWAATLRECPAEEQAREALDAWTRLEAWCKLDGRGLVVFPDDPPDAIAFASFDAGPGYLGSLASSAAIDEVVCLHVRPP